MLSAYGTRCLCRSFLYHVLHLCNSNFNCYLAYYHSFVSIDCYICEAWVNCGIDRSLPVRTLVGQVRAAIIHELLPSNRYLGAGWIACLASDSDLGLLGWALGLSARIFSFALLVSVLSFDRLPSKNLCASLSKKRDVNRACQAMPASLPLGTCSTRARR